MFVRSLFTTTHHAVLRFIYGLDRNIYLIDIDHGDLNQEGADKQSMRREMRCGLSFLIIVRSTVSLFCFSLFIGGWGGSEIVNFLSFQL